MNVKQIHGHAMEPTHSASILVEAFTVTAFLDTQEMGSSAQVHGLWLIHCFPSNCDSTDVNECEMSPSPCDESSADCINADGNFTCECRPGYAEYKSQCIGKYYNGICTTA